MNRLYARPDAAAYLGISPRTFDQIAAPFIPHVLIGNTGKRYDRDDLDQWAANQTKIYPAGVAGGAKPCATQKDRLASNSGARRGTSTKSSKSAKRGTNFANLLDAARSRRRASS